MAPAIALCVLAAAALAHAEIAGSGDLRVSVSGKLTPHRLPRTASAPVAVTIGGQISTTDGTEPPQLRKLTIEINRHGHLQWTGLPTCGPEAIRTASNGRALAACGAALVGRGSFKGTITLPGAAPYPIEGKLLVFNGTEGTRHVLLAHAYSPHPFATSFLITFAIERGGKGDYGTILLADLHHALGTQKNLTGIEMTLSRRYSYRGRQRSYVTAGCPAPKGFHATSFKLARTTFAFADGRTLSEVLNRSCGARG